VVLIHCSAFSAVTVKEHGAIGDGVTDDTVAIQKAIDVVGKTGGTLLFPAGTYVVTSVGLRPGVRYLGYGATIKRPAGQGKWVRTFNAAKQGYLHNAETDSPWLTIEGFTFDGNRAEQGEYRKYQLEQAHLIFLSAHKQSKGRLRARVVNCHFQDNVADGLSLYVNVDVRVINCSARDVFRGGITITGGNSRIQVMNFTAEGKTHPTGIDVEVDGAGYGGRKRIELMLSGIHLPDGDFDVGVSDDSVVLGSNISARSPFHLVSRRSRMKFSNSQFGIGRYSGYANRIVNPHDVTFHSCRFEIDPHNDSGKEPGKWAAVHVYWNVGQSSETNQALKLIDCDFGVNQGMAKEADTYAVYCEGDFADRNNRLIMEGGRISADFDHGIWFNQGGNLRLCDTTIAADTGMRLGSSGKWNIDAEVGGIRFLGNRYADIPTHGALNRIFHQNVIIDETSNRITTRYGIVRNRYEGRRIILGENPPTTKTHGLTGDVFRLKHPPADEPMAWICTKPGIDSGAVWSPLSGR
tara:strand:- start:65 stop:1630 length:1566 start_codon:yes stop_codon:yes gene_type:complete